MARGPLDCRLEIAMTVRRLLLPLLAVAAVVLAACTGDTSTSPAPTGSTSTDGTSEPTAPPSEIDPLVPYSPSPTPFTELTSGYLPETLTLPTDDDGKLYVTPESTAMTVVYVEGHRSVSFWMTLENPGETAWTGVPAVNAKLTDEASLMFLAIPNPTDTDLHPNPERYGFSNRDLHKEVTIGPGETLKGVIVFRPTGGNRPVVFAISLNSGETWAEWQTNLGPF